MKPKQIVTLSSVLSFFVALGCLSEAATYYVRPDGGSFAQCSGSVDALYGGSGELIISVEKGDSPENLQAVQVIRLVEENG